MGVPPWRRSRASFAHEQSITQKIGKLVDLALSESDHATNALLQWFLTEQVEEEANVDQIVHELKLAADAPAAIFMIDRELGARQLAGPSQNASPGINETIGRCP